MTDRTLVCKYDVDSFHKDELEEIADALEDALPEDTGFILVGGLDFLGEEEVEQYIEDLTTALEAQ
jgi:heptaprenylglyceryl phosphate synthase